jgi:putative tryptophan/tyrosine transport system substrate-binding protein
MSLGPGQLEGYYKAAKYVDAILRGADPANLPIAGAIEFNLSVRPSALVKFGSSLTDNLKSRDTD